LVGTDFYTTTLIDKNINYIFCNPPYSDYQNWVVKILKEGFCNTAYLIIPERWKENKAIKEVLENKDYKTEILFSGDFLNAERQARAKIDIVKINFKVKSKQNPTKFEKTNPFQSWFEEFFNVKVEKTNELSDSERKSKENQFKQQIKDSLIENKPLTEILIELYQEEQIKLIQNYKNLSSLDNELMTELNISLYSVMEGLRQKIQGLKNKYWKELFSRLDTITDKLTNYSRDLLLSILKENTQIDFTRDNIYAVILWVIKNANKYYDQQLIDLFYKLTKEENIKNYKSNQKTWKKEEWRYNKDNKDHSHYTLDYRLIMDCHDAGLNYGRFDESKSILSDLIVVAKNLGFDTSKVYHIEQDGKRRKINFFENKKWQSLIEYKAFKNGNLHLFSNKEFIKKFNIEASRLLGWIKSPKEAYEEFNEELNLTEEEANEMFNSNSQLTINNLQNILLLTE
jgi:hypothetical protein